MSAKQHPHRAVLYARVSTEEQASEITFPSQRKSTKCENILRPKDGSLWMCLLMKVFQEHSEVGLSLMLC